MVIRSLRYVNGAYIDSVVTGNSCAAPPPPPIYFNLPSLITTQQVTTGCVANGYADGNTGSMVRTFTYSNGVLLSDVVSSNTCAAPVPPPLSQPVPFKGSVCSVNGCGSDTGTNHDYCWFITNPNSTESIVGYSVDQEPMIPYSGGPPPRGGRK